jgi:glutathione synthase/RimK-type ligase-like ATP-grasp enzyme
MNKQIILITGYERFFGQTRKPWVSMNTQIIVDELKAKGFDVKETTFDQLVNSASEIRDSIIFYTFSQRENLRLYMRDIIYTLLKQGNLVIPNYELLLCHENKGYQECLKKELGINSLPALYFSSKRELDIYQLEFPAVLKTVDGSNGRGVFLVHNKEQLLIKIQSFEPQLPILEKLDLLRRKYLRLTRQYTGYSDFSKFKDYNEYKDYITPEKRFILQKFIPGLEFDYRVIIIGDRYYVTKRMNRKGDFRASGAKRFTFDFTASDELLEYAREIYRKFDSPCLSIDIGESHKQYYLFEYQASHFGINAIVKGKGYYRFNDKHWEFLAQKTCIEKALVSALVYHLQSKELF